MEKLLGPDIEKQITEILLDMINPIEFVLFLDGETCHTCVETKQLLSEVTALSPKLKLTVKDVNVDKDDVNLYTIEHTPSFVILDENKHYHGVKFNGIPAGHEINSFISAILESSGVPLEYDQETLAAIAKIDKPVNIKVFVTLSCPHCPGAVQTAHRLALLNPNVTAEAIEAQTFYELSQKYQVSGVPKIVINDTKELLGNQPVSEFLKEINTL